MQSRNGSGCKQCDNVAGESQGDCEKALNNKHCNDHNHEVLARVHNVLARVRVTVKAAGMRRHNMAARH